MTRRLRNGFALLSVALVPAALFAQEVLSPKTRQSSTSSSTAVEGYWQDVNDPAYVTAIDQGRLIEAYGDKVQRVAKILRSKGSRIELCVFGRDAVREWSFEGPDLVIRDVTAGQQVRLRRLPERLPVFELKPLVFPEDKPLSRERIELIQIELSSRLRKDQKDQHLKTPPQDLQPFFAKPEPEPAPMAFEFIDTASRNTGFLRSLISEVGWIDASRFGYSTANAAFLLVQHSLDLPLMLAALPRIKIDADAGRLNKEAYALLFDRLQLMLGEKQRYGSQLVYDRFGQPFIRPVEDSAKVEQLRESMGMVPLARYVKFAGGSEVRFSTECGSTDAKDSTLKALQ